MWQTLLLAFMRLMPLWFGLFFLGPLMAELCLRTGAAAWVGAPSLHVYGACITIGGLWGGLACKYGRWI